MPSMKITLDAAMRARDVSRPQPEHETLAQASEPPGQAAPLGRLADASVPGPGEPAPADTIAAAAGADPADSTAAAADAGPADTSRAAGPARRRRRRRH